MSFAIEVLDIKKELKNLYYVNIEKIKSQSPEWINALRDKSIKNFEKLGVPDKKNENYKYTNLEPSFIKNYKYQFEPKQIKLDAEELFTCDIPELDTYVAILLNGWYYKNDRYLQELDEGVIICSFAEAAKKYPELVEKHYAKYAKSDTDGLIALNTAFAQDGVFIYIPK